MRIFAARQRNEHHGKPQAKASGESFLGDFFLKRSHSPDKVKWLLIIRLDTVHGLFLTLSTSYSRSLTPCQHDTWTSFPSSM